MTHPKQREFDALLIYHWKRDSHMYDFADHVKSMFGKYPQDLAKDGMLRADAFYTLNMYVKTWIGSWLYPLSCKLFDEPDSMKVLNWMSEQKNLECSKRRKGNHYYDEVFKKAKSGGLHMQSKLMTQSLINEGSNRMANPNQVKARGRK